MTWPIGFSSLIGCSFLILEEAVNPESAKDSVRYPWPGGIPKDLLAKDRDEKIIERLKEKTKKTPTNISRTIQRVIKADREAH
jgi:hypothetical protein